MKNIVLCCDGTANEFAQNKTNVVNLFSLLIQDTRQIAYYHPGLGTMEPPGALTNVARKVTRLLGMAFGYGLESDIRDAYIFLMNNFEDGDRVFLFGFSRGAYTVRAVASLLYMYGLIRRGNETLVPYAIRMMTAIDEKGTNRAGARAEVGSVQNSSVDSNFALAHQFKSTFSTTVCTPWFVGVWDTVSSVGWIENSLKLPFTANSPDIEIGRQAVSIDERRAFFRQNLWRPREGASESGPKDLKQVWFPGVHCDVGGGYPEAESGLSKVALEWMIEEAEAAKLLFDRSKVDLILGKAPGSVYTRPNTNAKMHESLKGFWRIAEFVPKRHYDFQTGKWGRRMNLSRPRTIPPNSLIHASAFQRGPDYRARLPADCQRVGQLVEK